MKRTIRPLSYYVRGCPREWAVWFVARDHILGLRRCWAGFTFQNKQNAIHHARRLASLAGCEYRGVNPDDNGWTESRPGFPHQAHCRCPQGYVCSCVKQPTITDKLR